MVDTLQFLGSLLGILSSTDRMVRRGSIVVPTGHMEVVAGVEVRDSQALWLMSLLSLAFLFQDTSTMLQMRQTMGGKIHTS